MSDVHLYPVPDSFKQNAAIDLASYRSMYEQSVNDPETFWAEQATAFLTWQKPWSRVIESDLKNGEVGCVVDGTLNVSLSCIDRHLPARAQQSAIMLEGYDPSY